MRVKKYLVNSIEEAEASILADLGPTAMVLSTRPMVVDETGHTKIEVIAGAEKGNETKSSELPSVDDFKKTLLALEGYFDNEQPQFQPYLDFLTSKGIDPFLVRPLLNNISKRFGEAIFANQDKAMQELKRSLASAIHTTGPILLRKGTPQLVALVGPTGSGKTTTLVKLALQYRDVLQKKVSVIAHGAFSQVAKDQLQTLCNDFQLPMMDTMNSQTLLVALDAFRDSDLILIDTPGVHAEEALNQLSSLKGLQMHIVIGTDLTDRQALQSIKGYRSVDPAALIFSKLDEANSFGSLFNLHQQSGIPISYLSKDQELEIADPGEISNLILKK